MSDSESTLEGTSSSPETPAAAGPAVPARSRATRILRGLGWTGFAVVCLIFFTLMSLPEEKLKTYIQGQLQSLLAPKGITLTAGSSKVSVGFGVSYTMSEVTLSLPPPDAPAKIDKITVSPSILPMIFKRFGGRIRIENAGGKITADVSAKDTKVSLRFDASSFDAGKAGLLPVLASVRGSAVISGNGELTGDFSEPSSLNGAIDIDLGKLVLDAQPIAGFSVPRLNVTEGKIDLAIDKAKVAIKSLKLGKPGDDLVANASGEVTLGRQWESSTLNMKVSFSLSPNVLKSFILIDALLGAGKTGEGSYSFALTGPLYSPVPAPLGGGAPPAPAPTPPKAGS